MAVARRYSEAFFSYAVEKKVVDAVERDVLALVELWESSDVFRRVASSPVLGRGELVQVLAKSLKPLKLSKATARFCEVLASHRRMAQLPVIAEAFLARLHDSRGERRAVVISALPLNKAQLTAVEKALSTALDGVVSVEPEVDESLLGGMQVRMGSLMIDGSLENKLQRLHMTLRAAAKVS